MRWGGRGGNRSVVGLSVVRGGGNLRKVQNPSEAKSAVRQRAGQTPLPNQPQPKLTSR